MQRLSCTSRAVEAATLCTGQHTTHSAQSYFYFPVAALSETALMVSCSCHCPMPSHLFSQLNHLWKLQFMALFWCEVHERCHFALQWQQLHVQWPNAAAMPLQPQQPGNQALEPITPACKLRRQSSMAWHVSFLQLQLHRHMETHSCNRFHAVAMINSLAASSLCKLLANLLDSR